MIASTSCVRVLVAFLLLLTWASTARADLDVQVEVGHRGRWVAGAATPVTVTLENSGDSPIEVTLTLGKASLGEDGGGSGDERPSVFLGPGGERREVMMMLGPGVLDTLSLNVVVFPRTTIHHRRKSANKGVMDISLRDSYGQNDAVVLPMHGRIVGAVLDRRSVLATVLPEGNPSGMGASMRSNTERTAVLNVDARHLVYAPLILDGIDTLVVTNPDASFVAEPEALEGLLDWVALGGRLIVSLGSEAGSFATSPLAAHLPGRWTGVDQLAYSEVVPVDVPLEAKIAPRRGPFVTLEAVDAERDRVITNDTGRVELARRAFGRGDIFLLPYDLTLMAPLFLAQDKDHREQLVSRLNDLLAPMRVPKMSNVDSATGIAGMGGRVDIGKSMSQLVKQDAFTPPPLILVVLALAMYVIVVGPLDWLILKRIKKERLTTLTFTGSVVVFTVLAYGASFLLFSSGAVVNRVVLVDLTDGGRDGRELLRAMDIAGYYAPTGKDLEIDYEADAIVLPASLPTANEVSTGRRMPLRNVSKTPLRGTAELSIGFRSQRTIRATSVRPAGRSIDAAWVDSGPSGRSLELTNGLSISLDEVFVVLPDGRGVAHYTNLASGGTQIQAARKQTLVPGGIFNRSRSVLPEDPQRGDVLAFFAYLSQGHYLSTRRSATPFSRLTAEEMAELLKSGVDRSSSLDRGNALLIAFASESPIPIPESDVDGRKYVIIRKEIPLP